MYSLNDFIKEVRKSNQELGSGFNSKEPIGVSENKRIGEKLDKAFVKRLIDESYPAWYDDYWYRQLHQYK